MFVTRQKVLEENIGREEAAQVLTAIKMTPTATFVNLADDIETADQAAVIVRNVTKQNSIAGVVIIGGYDVVPADRLDVLDAPSRQRLQQMDSVRKDADRFIVFSDEIYGDTDGDYIAELPVSRIPDGRRADVVLNALNAGSFVSDRKFGVRNINRPFAAQVFPKIPGVRVDLNVSEQFAPAECPDGAAAGAVYLMLHGDHQDASRFWGEDSSGMAFEAFAVSNVPKTLKGTVVFAGCCWGALSMAPPAGIASATSSLRPRSPESSIAMAYLQAGALAFVGCTGTHYSPDESQPTSNFLGKPMHDAFWAEIAAGHPPADALFRAKKKYLADWPHGLKDPFNQAAEMKILRQFTCLGLGW